MIFGRRKTVDEIVAQFDRTVTELYEAADEAAEEARHCEEQIAILEGKREKAEIEAERAKRIAGNIKGMVR